MGITPKGKMVTPTRVVFNPNQAPIVDQCDRELGKPRMRKGKYAHYCYEWDELLIDETDFEFPFCKCGCPNPKT
jgi:hypothetical protein